MRRFIILLGLIAISSSALCQNSAIDSYNLRALLEEVRQLRHDLQTTTVAAQRIQIALYRLQLQDSAVARAGRLVEDAHSKLAALATERRGIAAQLEQTQAQRNRTQDAQERKALEDEAIPQLKQHLEYLAAEEEQWQAKADEAEGKLNVEQRKLDDLHAVLDQLEHALQNLERKAENNTSSR